MIRTSTRAEGGITAEERAKMDAITKKWVEVAFRTKPIDKEKITDAILRLYDAAGLKHPRVIIVPSPFVGSIASGIAATVWYLRKNKISHATEATDRATSDATDRATSDATSEATDMATDVATYRATRMATDRATDMATSEATYEATSEATYEATDRATSDATSDATRMATDEATYRATRMATDMATSEATSEATYEATDRATDMATSDATRMATDEATYRATRMATDMATSEATYEATDRATWLRDVIDIFTPKHYQLTLSCIKASQRMYQGGNMWASFLSYSEAMRDVLGLTGLPCWEKYQAWEDAGREGGFRYMHDEFCIVSDFPEILKVDDENRPHSTTGPSHRWRDGFEIYHLHGIRFEKEMFTKLTEGRMSFAEILSISDVDQRNQAMRFVGPKEREQFLEHVHAEKMDTYQKISVNGNPIDYTLYKLPKGDIFSQDTYAMWYICPSTGLDNFQGVPECKTVAEAMAWKMSDEMHTISPEEWKLMVPLVDEA